MRRFAFAAVALALTACGDFAVPDSTSVPDSPTWSDPVEQVLADHCVNCHGAKPDRGAPSGFRLDAYESQGGVAGASDMAAEIVDVVAGGEMPPGLGAQLGPNDTKILKKWAEAGAPQ